MGQDEDYPMIYKVLYIPGGYWSRISETIKSIALNGHIFWGRNAPQVAGT